jgi:hypothetical protein
MERHHENSLKRRDEGLTQLQKANFCLVEAQSEVEKDLLNEIMELKAQEYIAEEKRKGDMDDWARMHRIEIDQKDFLINKYKDEIKLLKKDKTSVLGFPW